MTSLLSLHESLVIDKAIVDTAILISTLLLLVLLVQKEISLVTQNERLRRIGQVLNIAIVPLLIAFVLIGIFKLLEVLS